MQILAVDDSDSMLDILQAILEGNNHSVTRAINGTQAKALLACSEFDVVLSDVHMPVIDGFELARHVRADNSLAGLPFIFVTGSADEEFREKCHAAGGTAWICKPFKPAELYALIDRVVG
jgi:two-component system, chemotaxis family, chemotaxis protein CheY